MVGVVLGQRIDKNLHLIYYKNNTINEAKVKYTVMKKASLTVVFGIVMLGSYLRGLMWSFLLTTML